jgi:16S rRNA (guanine966-N2)-methyltransferase
VTRIIGGAARGRRLRTPPGNATRPTADRVREALFSALESELGTLSGLHVLDLFAGSGAVGLEARSRGAASVVLVESDRATAGVIRQNAKELGFDQVRVDVARAERWVDHADQADQADQADPSARFDVVYADPPYPMSTADVSALLGRLAASGRLADDAVVVVERSRRGEGWVWPIGLEGVREKRYGETMLLYGRVGTSDATPTSPGSS